MKPTDNTPQEQTTKNPLAVMKAEVIDKTAADIAKMVEGRQIVLPSDYSVDNAMKFAWLKLQETLDKDKRPVLEVCSKVSVYNAILNMAIQGLNVAKNQGYFIAYGKTLNFQRSYFGDIALVKRLIPGAEVTYEVVYKGDDFKYSIERGQKVVSRHEQELENVAFENIVAAYCTIWAADGRVVKSEVMTIDRIKQSWKKSPVYKEGQTYGTHVDFTDDMVLRTVIRRTCKPVINSSADTNLKLAVAASDMDAVDAEFEEVVETEAMVETLEHHPEPTAQPGLEEEGTPPF